MVTTQKALLLVAVCYLTVTTSFAQTDSNKENVTVTTSFAQTDSNKGNEVLNCGRTNATSTHNASNVRRIAAREAEKGAWPWMAAVYEERNNKEKVPICAGALVSRSYVVTAGNCVSRRGQLQNESTFSVRLGEHDLDSDKDGMNPVVVNVTTIHLHEAYDPATFNADIALLRLEKPVDFNKHIQPICLPSELLGNENLENSSGYVAGWGVSQLGGTYASSLTEMSVTVADEESCKEAYVDRTTITELNICTVGINGSSPCTGFGGAPVMLPGTGNQYYLIGIVSFGVGCGNPAFPDVNTRVTMFVDWLKNHVE